MKWMKIWVLLSIFALLFACSSESNSSDLDGDTSDSPAEQTEEDGDGDGDVTTENEIEISEETEIEGSDGDATEEDGISEFPEEIEEEINPEIETDGDSIEETDGDLSESTDGDPAETPEGDGIEEELETIDGSEPEIGEEGSEDTENADEYEVPMTASIGGTIFIGSGFEGKLVRVSLFDHNPIYSDWNNSIDVVDFIVGAKIYDHPYTFETLAPGKYYMFAQVLENETPSSNGMMVPYADPIELDEAEVFSGANIYIGIETPALGRVTGKLFIHDDLADLTIVVMASRSLDIGGEDFWPSSVDYSFPPSKTAERNFGIMNLPDGEFYLWALIPNAPSGHNIFLHPTSPIAISGGADFDDTDFYLDVADPNACSISGEVHFSAARPGGTLAIVLFDSEPGPDVSPYQYLPLARTDDQTVIPFSLINLVEKPQVWVVAYYQLDSQHNTADFIGPLVLDSGAPETQNHTGIVLELGMTILSGTVTLSGVDATPSSQLVTRILLTNADQSEIGGHAEFLLSPEDGDGDRIGYYEMFPAMSGSWLGYLVADTNGDYNFENDPVCPLGAVQVDGSQLAVTFDIEKSHDTCISMKIPNGW